MEPEQVYIGTIALANTTAAG